MRKRRSIFRFLSVLAASSLLLCSLSCGKRESGKDETASSSVTEASKEGGESVSSESGGEKSSADGERASVPAEESRKPKDASSSAEESRKPEDLPKGKSISGTVRDGSMNSVVIDGEDGKSYNLSLDDDTDRSALSEGIVIGKRIRAVLSKEGRVEKLEDIN